MSASAIELPLNSKEILELALREGASHICQKQGWAYDLENATASALTKSPPSFFTHPLSVILKPGHAVSPEAEAAVLSFERIFNSSVQKESVLNDLQESLKTVSNSQSFIDQIVAVADELVTNVLFNAPFVRGGRNPGKNRLTEQVDLENGKVGRLFFGVDESRLALCCEDPFGSLNLKNYLSRILRCYEQGVSESINFGTGGAGIGSYIIFEAGTSSYIGVCPGRKTLVGCVVPYKMSGRRRGELPKHLHVIEVPGVE